jgi:RAB protein geranylgeranyltransferase component A
VPATLDEALMTSLIGLFEKRRFRNFLSYLAKYDEKDPNTYGGASAASFFGLFCHSSLWECVGGMCGI